MSSQPRQPILRVTPAVKYLLLFLIAIHLAQLLLLSETVADEIILHWGFIPARFVAARSIHDWQAWLTPVSYIALHAGFLHLGVNALGLLAFGTIIERIAGKGAMLQVFILSGIGGALGELVVNPNSLEPIIGASASVSGLFAVVLMVLSASSPRPALRLALLATITIVTMLVAGDITMMGVDNPVASLAHLGGLATGLIWAMLNRNSLGLRRQFRVRQ